MRRARNCALDPNRAIDVPHEIIGCPSAFFTAEERTLYADWRTFSTLGVLPYGETMGDQPAFVVEGFRVCAEIERAAGERRRIEELSRLLAAKG